MTNPLNAATLAAALAAGAAVHGAENEALKGVSTMLLTQPLGTVEGKQAIVALVEAPGGFETPWHTHPGDVFVYVLEGTIQVEFESGEVQSVGPGEVLYETPDMPMVGRNVSASDNLRFVVFQVGDVGAAMTLPHEKH